MISLPLCLRDQALHDTLRSVGKNNAAFILALRSPVNVFCITPPDSWACLTQSQAMVLPWYHIARIAEALICLIYSLNAKQLHDTILNKTSKAKSAFRSGTLWKIASGLINDVVWSFASSAFAAILGHIGDDMVAGQMQLLLWW